MVGGYILSKNSSLHTFSLKIPIWYYFYIGRYPESSLLYYDRFGEVLHADIFDPAVAHTFFHLFELRIFVVFFYHWLLAQFLNGFSICSSTVAIHVHSKNIMCICMPRIRWIVFRFMYAMFDLLHTSRNIHI